MLIKKIALAAIAAATFASQSIMAEAPEFSGYFRLGTGNNRGEASRACYDLGKANLKYRLGNECDTYGEFELRQNFSASGVDFKAVFMPSYWDPQTGRGEAESDVAQMYLEGKGFDLAPGSSFWIGKRFYGRAKMHITDTKITVMDGVGAGVSGLPAGSSKLSLAYFPASLDKASNSKTDDGQRFNAELYDIATNAGGTLRIVGTLIRDNSRGGQNGSGITIQHDQEKLIGNTSNTLWLQYARGAAGLNGGFAHLARPATGSDRSWRLVDSINWQSGPYGGQAQIGFGKERDAGVDTSLRTIGGRLSYAVTQNFKWLAELGHSAYKPAGGDTARLNKFTIAPTLATGPGFWNRPELRFYVTHARWNTAAGNVTGVAAYNGDTAGTSWGAQIEHWF